ncbi:unnamed protein product [Mytilus edulis]|uniref:Novel STAND NTPase 3 domain-containing protein n=1 Tax=Mytilus edulis TaxID=6550 RepID=A0A8S3T6G6_MYTED|nr:unnamed protein product [Mytilus edulis]
MNRKYPSEDHTAAIQTIRTATPTKTRPAPKPPQCTSVSTISQTSQTIIKADPLDEGQTNIKASPTKTRPAPKPPQRTSVSTISKTSHRVIKADQKGEVEEDDPPIDYPDEEDPVRNRHNTRQCLPFDEKESDNSDNFSKDICEYPLHNGSQDDGTLPVTSDSGLLEIEADEFNLENLNARTRVSIASSGKTIIGGKHISYSQTTESEGQEKSNLIDTSEACVKQHEKEKPNVKTKGLSMAKMKIELYRKVVLSSGHGCGKTYIGKLLLQHYSKFNDQFNRPKKPVIIGFPHQWSIVVNPNEDLIILLDDIFGKVTVNKQKLDDWKRLFSDIHTCINNDSSSVFVIITPYTVFPSQKLHINIMDSDTSESRTIFKNVAEFCNIKNTYNNLIGEMEVKILELEHIYISHDCTGVYLISDVILGAMVHTVGENQIYFLLKHMDLSILLNYTTIYQAKNKEFVIDLRFHRNLINRYLEEIGKGSLKDIVESETMENYAFVEQFVSALVNSCYFKNCLGKPKGNVSLLSLAMTNQPPRHKLLEETIKYAQPTEKGIIRAHSKYSKWYWKEVSHVLKCGIELNDRTACLIVTSGIEHLPNDILYTCARCRDPYFYNHFLKTCTWSRVTKCKAKRMRKNVNSTTGKRISGTTEVVKQRIV